MLQWTSELWKSLEVPSFGRKWWALKYNVARKRELCVANVSNCFSDSRRECGGQSYMFLQTTRFAFEFVESSRSGGRHRSFYSLCFKSYISYKTPTNNANLRFNKSFWISDSFEINNSFVSFAEVLFSMGLFTLLGLFDYLIDTVKFLDSAWVSTFELRLSVEDFGRLWATPCGHISNQN